VKVDPKLDGQWEEKEKVFCLVANGRRRFFSTSSHFPPKQLHLNLHFLSFDIKVLLYHGPRPLFTHAIPFPWPINYDHISWCHNYPHLHYRFDFFEDFSSLAWNYGVVIVTFYGPQSRTSEWRTTFGVIFRFDLNATSLWRRTQTSKGVSLSWNWTPSSRVLLYFVELPHPGDLIYKSTLLSMTNLKLSAKVVTKPKTFLSSFSLQFLTLDTIVDCAVRFVDCLLIARWTT